jgi:predicted permease
LENILLIFICIGIGIGLQRVPAFPKNGYLALNQYVIYVALPAMTLYYIPKIELNATLLYPVLVPWIGFFVAFLFFYSLGKLFHWPKKLVGALILTAGLGNTSFVGFPLVKAFFGEAGLKAAILVDQPGTFVVLSTAGVFTASYFASGTASWRSTLRKVAVFPPFIAFAIAGTLLLFQMDFPEAMQGVCKQLGATVSTVALLSVGLQLKLGQRSKHWGFLTLGLVFKLVLTPLLFVFLYKIVIPGKGLLVDVSLIESAMPPMISGAILASNYGLKPKLSNLMVGVGIPLSLLTVYLWYLLLI